jgi:exodeoxyribonuclease VII large subunit
MNRNSYSIFEVSQKIQVALEAAFPSTIWVIGEISEIKENRTGHCYLELVEKETTSDQPKAKARATIWARTYRMLKPFFETSTGRTLASGIKILVQCVVNYHPVYGLSFNIIDIDPTFTIGDIEKVRQQTINRLIADGIMDMNKELGFPMLPKNVAVISSPTAAGFEDFVHQIESNSFGYKINIKLFSAVMQGEKAEESIINALNQIHESQDKWDVVAIVRGGGSQIDLGCFDSYNLANNIAQFPIPIITGIGHEKDITIADMVASNRLKTPTAVAEFLISQFVNAENWLIEASDNYTEALKHVINLNVQKLNKYSNKVIPVIIKQSRTERVKLERIVSKSEETVDKFLLYKNNELRAKFIKLTSRVELRIEKFRNLNANYLYWMKSKPIQIVRRANDMLSFFEKNADALNPERVLTRGFSITLSNGKPVKSYSTVHTGDSVETILANGKIVSIVEIATQKRDKLV